MSLLRSLASAALVTLSLAACGIGAGDGSSEDENGTRGPGSIHSGWFKTPEAISQTIAQTWEIQLTEEEDLALIGGLRAALGGVSVSTQSSLVDQPHELYALATHSLASALGEKLVAKQIDKTARGELYLFDGLGFAGEDDGCYADDSKTWCDGKDEIVIGSLTASGMNPNAPTNEQRKRLMHKMQSIGEFFLMAIDERTTMPGEPGSSVHAPAYLLDEVFLPKLREGALSKETEAAAWSEVVTTILMSGYFFDLPADE